MGRPIIVAGHICLDIIPKFLSASLPAPGALTQIGPATFAPGGAVANVGGALARLGAAVRLLATTGRDPMGGILSSLLPAGADQRILQSADESTSYSLVLAPIGQDRSFLHCPGANHAFDPASVDASILAGAAALHFGYPPAMRSTYLDGGKSIASMFARARAAGVRTSLDFCGIDPSSESGRVDWRAWMAIVLPEVDLFTPSLPELDDALHRKTANDQRAIESVAAEVLGFGSAAIAIKLGEDGLYLRSSDDSARVSAARLGEGWRGASHFEPCFKVRVATATGAGDCTIAGLIHAIESGSNPAAAAAFANAVGACSCEAPDATSGVPAAAVVRARIHRGWSKHPSSLV